MLHSPTLVSQVKTEDIQASPLEEKSGFTQTSKIKALGREIVGNGRQIRDGDKEQQTRKLGTLESSLG